MNFLKPFSPIFIFFGSLFLFFYAVLFIKTIIIALKLRSSFRDIFLKFFLRSTYFVLIIVSVLAPTFGSEKRTINITSKEIYFAIDNSRSMNCTDVKPSRLDKSKIEIQKIISELVSDKIGLISFNSTAQVLCPLTTDYNSFTVLLQSINTFNSNQSSTNISSPLELFINKISTSNTSENKVLVVFSDGEDFSTNLSETIQKIANTNSNIITVGVGTTIGSKIPSNSNNFIKDKNGQFAVSKLNNSSLVEIAETKNNKYFEISDIKNEQQQIITYLKNIQSETKINKLSTYSKENKYIYFLFIAFILIIFDIIFNVKVIHI